MECGAHTNPDGRPAASRTFPNCWLWSSWRTWEQRLTTPGTATTYHNGRMWRILRAFAFLRFLWMHLNCRIILLVSSLLDPLGGWTVLTGVWSTSERARGRLSVVGYVAGLLEAMWPAKGLSAAASWSGKYIDECTFLSASGSRLGNAAATWRKQSHSQVMMKMFCSKGGFGWSQTRNKQNRAETEELFLLTGF